MVIAAARDRSKTIGLLGDQTSELCTGSAIEVCRDADAYRS
jgi:hypothetical protein